MNSLISRPSRSTRAVYTCAAILLALTAIQSVRAQSNANESSDVRPALNPSELDGKQPAGSGAIIKPDSPSDDFVPTDALTNQPLPAGVMDPILYGWWVLLPPFVAIVLAILFRSAVPALIIGVLVGAYMMVPCLQPADRFSDHSLIAACRVAFERYVVDAIIQSNQAAKEHLLIVLFTLTIGGMVGIITVNGGTQALVKKIARFAKTSRSGQVVGWCAGMIVFFDDYANSMIVGPTLRPIFDKLKISRAKLAFIVDSTSAPIASVALIGTWLGAELGYIQSGLDLVARGPTGTPLFLAGTTDWDAFLYSIPYRFYALFALWMVLVLAITGRDFGPMRKAEQRALIETPHDWNQTGPTENERKATAWLGALPILVLIGVTVLLLYITGRAGLPPGNEPSPSNILKNADSYVSIFYGAVSSITVALLLTLIARACSIRNAVDGAIDGMARMFPAIVILVLAWALSSASQELKLGDVLQEKLIRADIAPSWLPLHMFMPLIIFLCAAAVSFATGSSWATMGILTPVAIQITAGLGESMAIVDAREMFYASVGSVLAGSIFGDHCSPISDTTVLSSVASSCRLEEHVWTQMPYAVVTAIVAMAAGNLYCARFHAPPYVALIFGGVIIVILVFLLGRKKDPPPAQAVPLAQATLDRRVRGGS